MATNLAKVVSRNFTTSRVALSGQSATTGHAGNVFFQINTEFMPETCRVGLVTYTTVPHRLSTQKPLILSQNLPSYYIPAY